jgi:hypothetical protein
LGWIQSNNHIMVNGRKKKCIIGSGVRWLLDVNFWQMRWRSFCQDLVSR